MIIIPARIASTRFPRKVLVDIGGVPMVIRTANAASKADTVVIATDSDEVADVCKKHGYESVMTGMHHSSGTERVNEAAEILGLKSDEIIINLQGDEPFMESEVIIALKKRLDSAKERGEALFMASCYTKIDKDHAHSPNGVKVVLDKNGDAIYFSRSLIPFDRDGGYDDYNLHLGIYGFFRETLKEFCAMPKSPLEDIEKLEQLRALYNAKKISMIEVVSLGFGIDTPQDLERAVKSFL